jgi:hypothetical protein
MPCWVSEHVRAVELGCPETEDQWSRGLDVLDHDVEVPVS